MGGGDGGLSSDSPGAGPGWGTGQRTACPQACLSVCGFDVSGGSPPQVPVRLSRGNWTPAARDSHRRVSTFRPLTPASRALPGGAPCLLPRGAGPGGCLERAPVLRTSARPFPRGVESASGWLFPEHEIAMFLLPREEAAGPAVPGGGGRCWRIRGTWHLPGETRRVRVGSSRPCAQGETEWTAPSSLHGLAQPPGRPRGWRGTCPWDRRQVCSPFFPVPSPSPSPTSELQPARWHVLSPGAPSRAAPGVTA